MINDIFMMMVLILMPIVTVWFNKISSNLAWSFWFINKFILQFLKIFGDVQIPLVQSSAKVSVLA